MLFGNKESFAVQVEIDEDYGGPWLFGKFCYWLNGTRVGDYDLGTSLRDVLLNLKWIVNDRGNRRGEDLCNYPGEHTFDLLDRSLYGDDHDVSKVLLPALPARFDVRPPVDVFDCCKIYLMECGDNDLFMVSDVTADPEIISIVRLPIGLFDSVIKRVYDHLENLYDEEVKGR